MSLTAQEQSVLAIEDDYVRAEWSRDEGALRQLVDDRFVLNRSNGTTAGKEELITSILGMGMAGQGPTLLSCSGAGANGSLERFRCQNS